MGEIANRQLVKVDMTFGDVPIGIVEENGATTFLKALVVLDEARKAGKIDYKHPFLNRSSFFQALRQSLFFVWVERKVLLMGCLTQNWTVHSPKSDAQSFHNWYGRRPRRHGQRTP